MDNGPFEDVFSINKNKAWSFGLEQRRLYHVYLAKTPEGTSYKWLMTF